MLKKNPISCIVLYDCPAMVGVGSSVQNEDEDVDGEVIINTEEEEEGEGEPDPETNEADIEDTLITTTGMIDLEDSPTEDELISLSATEGFIIESSNNTEMDSMGHHVRHLPCFNVINRLYFVRRGAEEEDVGGEREGIKKEWGWGHHRRSTSNTSIVSVVSGTSLF